MNRLLASLLTLALFASLAQASMKLRDATTNTTIAADGDVEILSNLNQNAWCTTNPALVITWASGDPADPDIAGSYYVHPANTSRWLRLDHTYFLAFNATNWSVYDSATNRLFEKAADYTSVTGDYCELPASNTTFLCATNGYDGPALLWYHHDKTARATGTNALAQLAAVSAAASNIIAHVSPTQHVYYAALAGALLLADNVQGSFSVDSSNLYLYFVTNSDSVYVSATNGTDYNGPAVGSIWADGYTAGDPGQEEWYFTANGIYSLNCENLTGERSGTWLLSDNNPNTLFNGVGPLPAVLTPTAYGTGSITIAWVPVTNTVAIPIAGLTNLLINGIEAVVDGRTATVTLPVPSYQEETGYALVVASTDWLSPEFVTNDAIATLSYSSLGYVWRVAYSQYTNAPQSRTYGASMKAPAIKSPVLTKIRTVWMAHNEDDSLVLAAYTPGQSNAIWTVTNTAVAVDTIKSDEYTITNWPAAPSITWRATPSVTAQTDDGSWTALPMIDAVFGGP